MDKYNKKTAFQKWFSAINFKELSKEAQNTIKNFDYYHKKLDFETTLRFSCTPSMKSYPAIVKSLVAFWIKSCVKKSELTLSRTVLYLVEEQK